MTRRHKLGILALALGAALALPIPAAAAHPIGLESGPGAGVEDLLPDLRMADLYDIHLQRARSGDLRLRFGTIVWNLGRGPLEARIRGRDGREMTDVRQIIYRSDGATRSVDRPNLFAFYSGDGHNHWHLPGFVVVLLTAIPQSGQPVPTEIRRLRKIGFCLTDNFRAPDELRPPNSAPRAFYSWTGCGKRNATKLKMGISVGFGDEYKEWFAHQLVNVTGVPAGSYRLCATPNQGGDWLESDNLNNSSWTDITMNPSTMTVTILRQGTGDCSVPPAP
ncbi:MAG TPA: hypothetical protein VIF08_05185 [Candidatus Limnocylindrales bacterium]|jgi:hypothetical protein